ncbi:MAG TPA: diacylglycerol kinase family protein [Dehalococcoidales bacterium]|nr:diacylglycerol kinase family protein [Dehalococcoidales bacterium]
MKQRIKVIVNPAAGANSTQQKWPGIQRLLKSLGLIYEFQFTEGRGHGIELSRKAAEDGYQNLVAVGGDGTVHEVTNGIMQTSNAQNTHLGIICTGTGSDLARTLGITHDVATACSRLAENRRQIIDLGLVTYTLNGKVEQRYFVNGAGIGFDATVVAATNRIPKFLGDFSYLLGLLLTFLTYRNKPVTYQIGEKGEVTSRMLSLVVANGEYFGGGMHIAPQAKTDDQQFDIVALGNFGKIELIRNLSKVYKGTHLSHPKVHMEKNTSIRVQSKHRMMVQADGELLGEGPAEFKLIPSALCLAI